MKRPGTLGASNPGSALLQSNWRLVKSSCGIGALDRLGNALRRICYANAVFNHRFYQGRVEAFYSLMMQIERSTLHRSHILSNVATRLDSGRAEVERHGAAYSTLDGETLIVLGGGI